MNSFEHKNENTDEKETINQDDIVSVLGERPFASHTSYNDILNASWTNNRRDGNDDGQAAADDGADAADGEDGPSPALAMKGQ